MRIDTLVELARDSGLKVALTIGDASCTYRELFAGVQRWDRRLADCGVETGAVVGITGESCLEMIMLLIALVQGDRVAVPFLSSSAQETQAMMATADVDGLFHFGSDGQAVWNARICGARHPLIQALRAQRHPGLILFTSGSSGAAKAALHDVSRIWQHCDRSGKRPATAIVFLMIDHIGGINTLLHVLLAGGTAVFPADRTVETVCRTIQDHGVELLPATPTFLNMLLLSGQRDNFDLSSLKLVTYGTEPMPPTTLTGLKQAFPRVRCKQTYGMTETGILPTQSEQDDSVWVKVGGPGFETRVVDGVLWLRTETSMLGYLNAPSPFDESGWLNTGDLVEVRDGALRILGRQSEVINVAGEKVHPGEIEDVILQVDNIVDVVVTQKISAITGHIVVATVRLHDSEDHRAVAARVRQHCQSRLSAYKVPALIKVADEDLYGRRFKKIRQAGAVASIGQEA